jgi:HK97 family phage major capsid protein
MAGIDLNRTTTGVNLPPAVSSEIWAATQQESAAMQLARQIPLPGSGVSVSTITGDPVAEWVDETEAKPVSRPTLGHKILTPYKLAVIVPFSNEFRRDLPALYQAIVNRLPGALAKRFDETVFTDNVPPPGSNFDKLSNATAVDLGPNIWAGLVTATTTIANAGGILNGWALSPQGSGVLLGAVDGNGRPLFVSNVSDAAVPSLLGAPVYVSRGVYDAGPPPQIGFAGDWSYAVYGTVEGVQVSTADQATLVDGANTINLWQQNMFAVRAEIEIGFRVRDLAAFSRLTYTAPVGGATASSPSSSRTSDKADK